MLSQQEQKKIISYSQLENKIIFSEKFKLIGYQLQHPENKNYIIPFLEMKRSLINILPPITNRILSSIIELTTLLKSDKILMYDLYNQMYIQLLNYNHLKIIYSELENAVLSGKLSLNNYCKTNDILKDLAKIQPTIKDYSTLRKNNETKSDNLAEKVFTIKCVRQLIQCSGIIDYIKKVINEAFNEKTDKWNEYNEIIEMLTKENISKQDQSILNQLKQSAELTLSTIPGSELFLSYAKIDKNDLKSLIDFINNKYQELPENAQNKLTQDILIIKISEDPLPIKIDAPSLTIPDKKIEVSFQLIQQEVYKLLDKMVAREEYESLPENIPIYTRELLEDVYTLFENNKTAQYFSFFAFLSYTVYYYSDLKPDVLIKMFSTEHENHTSIQYLTKAAVPSLIHQVKLLESDLALESDLPEQTLHLTFARYYRKLFAAHSLEVKSPYFNKLDFPAVNDPHRSLLLNKLNLKEMEYRNDLNNAIYFLSKGASVYIPLAKKLMARLAAVNYIREQLASNKALSSSVIRNELLKLFQKRVFETRFFGDSFITQIVKELDLPPVSVANTGIFKKEKTQENISKPITLRP